ncbi:MAG: polysaccharide biosynthesis C-terminal domain-containing protein [Paludibacteraceae bacterium]|nr:polysaccharide biosynthesis C-terminal domain-containing protein [Paludibacteraceae bacterium]MBN2787060.1 polysaccharide biosynthesis C-terminal domain-containing protein [Paludibacteraceae bacterium]
MGKMKSLAKDTAIYGVSSILGRFLNWCLVPIYTYVLKDSAEYGIITNLYAWTALLLVLLTYGMETGFFRFMNKETENPQHVYSTTLLSIGFSSLLFAIGIIILQNPITQALGYNGFNEYIWMMGIVVAVDAFTSIPFVYLRQQKRPIKFAAIKLAMIFINIALNLFFLIVCPWLLKTNPDLVNWFYNPNYGVGYILIANLVSTSAVLVMLLPEIFKASLIFDKALLKRMLSYSFPLLILGVAGIANQTIDKIIFPFLYHDYTEGMRQLGIYGACFKVAMVMMMFTQAFRFAYEPFVFGQHKDKNSKEAYSDAMKFFVIFSLLIFLGMVFYLDFIKLLIAPSYWEGLQIVPIILASYLFQGIYFNLSLWYKLTDKTRYGAYFSIIGLVLNFTINFFLIPIFGYIACAWASFASYFLIMLLSYFYGQKYFPIDYQLIKISRYVLITLAFFGISLLLVSDSAILNYGIKTILIITFLAYFVKKDFPLQQVPIINRFFKKTH